MARESLNPVRAPFAFLTQPPRSFGGALFVETYYEMDQIPVP
jgi:hypothetical protein